MGLQVYSQLKVMHWQTSRHNAHKLLEQLYEQFDQLNDKLVELLFTIEQKKIGVGAGSIIVKNINATDNSPLEYVKILKTYYEQARNSFANDNQATTIIDEILILFRKYEYLFKMNLH